MKIPILNKEPRYFFLNIKNININFLYVFLKNKVKQFNYKKNKRLIRGSGKKPWPQKGTGRARSGDKKSPIWKGGGVTFNNSIFSKQKKIKNIIENFIFLFLINNKLFIFDKKFFLMNIFLKKKNFIFDVKKLKICDFLKFDKIFIEKNDFFYLLNNILK